MKEITVFRSKAADHSLSKSALNNNKYKILAISVSGKFASIIFIIIYINRTSEESRFVWTTITKDACTWE